MTKLYRVTTSRLVEEEWRVYAENEEEARKIINDNDDPDSDENVEDITELGYENLTIIQISEDT